MDSKVEKDNNFSLVHVSIEFFRVLNVSVNVSSSFASGDLIFSFFSCRSLENLYDGTLNVYIFV